MVKTGSNLPHRLFPPAVGCYPEGTSCKLARRSTAWSFERKAWRIEEVKDRLYDPRFVDRYLPNVANVTGNSRPSRFPDKVHSLRGSERAPLPLSRDVGAVALLNRVFASFRLSTRPPPPPPPPPAARETFGSNPEDLTRNFCNSGLSCHGEPSIWRGIFTAGVLHTR